MAATILISCQKDIKTSDVISGLTLSSHSIDADGTTTVDLSVVLNKDAGASKLNVIFSASSGTLTGGTDGKVTAKADYVNQQLVAKASLTAPMSPGKIIITAAPQATSPNGDYILKDSLVANPVFPATLQLTASSFGIGSNFTSIDTLTGSLRSAQHKKVSTGAKVLFEDFLSNGTKATGRFRSNMPSSDGDSKVIALYSAPQLPIGTNIKLAATYLTSDGNKTTITDTVVLTINQ